MKVLRNEYFLFSIIVLIAICFIMTGFCCYSYRGYERKKNTILLELTKDLSFDLSRLFNENENILKFFGSKIANHIDHRDLNAIFNLLISNVSLNIASMTNSYLSWANAEGKIVVCGKHGIMPTCGKSKKKNLENRNIQDKDYFIIAKQNPWTLQISKPCNSFSGNSYILPTAMGVVNKYQKFIGYLILGLRIDRINHYIEKLINPKKASYILLDQNFQYITSSEENLADIGDILHQYQDKMPILNFIKNKHNNVVLPIYFKYNNIKYNFISKIPDYPFFLLLGYDLNLYKHDFLNRINPIFIEFFVMGVLYIILLYFFRKKIISPITNLSKLAFSISSGNLQVEIPRQNSIELLRLAKSLELVLDHIKKTDSYVKKLEFANQIAKDSDYAKAEFIKIMNNEFANYFKQVMLYFNFFYNYMKNNISLQNHKIIQYSNKIQELITIINTKISNKLTLNYLNINSIIEDAIKINLKIAFIKNTNIKFDFQKDLPKIHVDEIKIKQIFINLIKHSIENSPHDSTILISTNSYIENNLTWIEINIIDNSFGLDEYSLETIQHKFNNNQDLTMFDFMKINVEAIEKIILMHKGSLKIINKSQQGREVQILLPLLEKQNYLEKCDVTHFIKHKFSSV